ncbi:4-hydroxybenzoate polyprenyltransferase [Brevundimonas sp. AAP58]|uniref:4-hydroxybenzoate octaprenyltransferase n=1 Tax=Brevundimonas sp. AAP58 TaxID=1523422 RepID=UPI0006B9DC3D|nr:4-hydroxybenzoate octaprenyltransferase [Brevundimonas sp. AAP58]KPF80895.1 4-hydroxybenzoate polyprenyltransferase [Brevundimonas sp. AAP58]
MSAPLPDAGQNWVDARAPEAWKPWLKLGRFDRPVGIWLLLLPGWQGIALALAAEGRTPGPYEAWLILGFGIGACLMRAAGCAFNDIVDRDVDRRVARTAGRPVASGQISVKQAWAFIVACSLMAFLILLTLGGTAILLGFGSLALVAAYPFMKRITWWPQAWLGITFNWGALMGFAAASGELTATAVLLWIGGVFWTLGYDTIYALQDVEDDALVGVKSTARRLGSGVRPGVAVFYAGAVLSAGLAGVAARLWPLFFIGLAAYALHLAWQGWRLRPDDGALALRLFKSNRDAGLILLAAIAAGALSVSL